VSGWWPVVCDKYPSLRRQSAGQAFGGELPGDPPPQFFANGQDATSRGSSPLAGGDLDIRVTSADSIMEADIQLSWNVLMPFPVSKKSLSSLVYSTEANLGTRGSVHLVPING
jgi:hypothetical protein